MEMTFFFALKNFSIGSETILGTLQKGLSSMVERYHNLSVFAFLVFYRDFAHFMSTIHNLRDYNDLGLL